VQALPWARTPARGDGFVHGRSSRLPRERRRIDLSDRRRAVSGDGLRREADRRSRDDPRRDHSLRHRRGSRARQTVQGSGSRTAPSTRAMSSRRSARSVARSPCSPGRASIASRA
jgi:hypothetical protein